MKPPANPIAWSEQVRDAESQVRETFIESHLDLVRYLALRIASRLPSGIELNDLVHDGIVGLLDATEKYDPGRRVRFRTYAESRIRGAILDGLRQKDWRPRSVRAIQRQLDETVSALSTAHHRPATEDEIAGALGVDLEAYRSMLRDSSVGPLLSLEELPFGGDLSISDDDQRPDQPLEQRDLLRAMAEEIEHLPDRERKILALYYHDGLNMKEIGAVLGITESRVCQLHGQAASRLRVALQQRLHVREERRVVATAGEEAMTDQPLVSADEMASVLGSDENQQATPTTAGDGTPVAYSLRRPLTISPEDEEQARARVQAIAESLVATIRRQLDATIECEERGFQQQQTATAVGSLEEPAWILAFEAEGGGGVAFVMDPACSMSLIELALGGTGTSSASGRAPTNLESRVMNNLGRALLEPFSAKTGLPLVRPLFTIGAVPTEVATAGEMVAASILKLKFGEAERGALLLATSSLLREANAEGDDTPVASGPLTERLSKVLVEIRPVLRAGKVSLQDLTELRPGSVLQLESDEQRELDLRVQGLGLMRGRISREEGSVQFGVTWRRPGSSQEPVAAVPTPTMEEPS